MNHFKFRCILFAGCKAGGQYEAQGIPSFVDIIAPRPVATFFSSLQNLFSFFFNSTFETSFMRFIEKKCQMHQHATVNHYHLCLVISYLTLTIFPPSPNLTHPECLAAETNYEK